MACLCNLVAFVAKPMVVRRLFLASSSRSIRSSADIPSLSAMSASYLSGGSANQTSSSAFSKSNLRPENPSEIDLTAPATVSAMMKSPAAFANWAGVLPLSFGPLYEAILHTASVVVFAPRA